MANIGGTKWLGTENITSKSCTRWTSPTPVDSAVTEKAIELQGSIIALQTGILEMQAQLQNLTQEKLNLEKSLKEAMSWKAEDEKHELVTIVKGVHVIRTKNSKNNDASDVGIVRVVGRNKSSPLFSM